MLKMFGSFTFYISAVSAVTWSSPTILYNKPVELNTFFCDVDSIGDGYALWNDDQSDPNIAPQIKWTDETSGVWTNPNNINLKLKDLTACYFSVNDNLIGLLLSKKQKDTNTIYANILKTNLVWGDPFQISDSHYYSSNAIAATCATGDSLAMWASNDGTYNSVFARKYFGGTWEPIDTLTATGVNAYNPSASINSVDTALACWSISDSGYLRIQVRKCYLAEWEPTTYTLSSATANSMYPRCVVNLLHEGLVAWGQYSSTGTLNIYACHLDDLGIWSSPSLVSSPSAYITQYPQVTLESILGDGMCVWVQSDGSNTRVTAAKYDNLLSWQSPTYVSAAGKNAFSFKILGDTNGNIICVWKGVESVNNILYAATNQGSWSSVQTLSDPTTNVGNFSLGINDTGDIICGWSCTDSNNNTIVQVKTASF